MYEDILTIDKDNVEKGYEHFSKSPLLPNVFNITQYDVVESFTKSKKGYFVPVGFFSSHYWVRGKDVFDVVNAMSQNSIINNEDITKIATVSGNILAQILVNNLKKYGVLVKWDDLSTSIKIDRLLYFVTEYWQGFSETLKGLVECFVNCLILRAIDNVIFYDSEGEKKPRFAAEAFSKLDSDFRYLLATDIPRRKARKAALEANKDNHADRDYVKNYYKENINKFKSPRDAATFIDKMEPKLVRAKWRTIYDWLREEDE